MKLPKLIELLYVPAGVPVEAEVMPLTRTLIRRSMGAAWWRDPAVDPEMAEAEIDRHWDWSTLVLERGGAVIRSRKLCVRTGDGAIQGAMMVSTTPVACEREVADALLVELLFVAPRNRHWIRVDGQEQFRGIGVQLLRTAVELSLEAGLAGRLKLESSPDFVGWYEKRGLLRVPAQRIMHEGVQHTPMELSAERVSVLMPELKKAWSARGKDD